MIVVEVAEFGGPEVLVVSEDSDLLPGSGQAVLDLAYAEVLFLDTQLRKGWGQDYFPLIPPFVPGVGVSGVVRAVGNGVDPGWTGRRVISGTGGTGAYLGGGYAEQVRVPAQGMVEVPASLGLDVALAALSDGSMALGQLDLAALTAEDAVLVTGAAGSIGTWLLPLAQAAGLMVVAAARGEEKLDLALARGADAAVDYDRDDLDGAVHAALGGRRLTVVFDGVGGEVGTAASRHLDRGGRFLAYGSASGDFADTTDAAARGVTVIGLSDKPPIERATYAARALSMLEAGEVTVVIGQSLPLAQAADAHRAIEERRVRGKSLLVGPAAT